MRQQDKIIIWPAYFDLTRSRGNGRRVSRNLAVSTPRISEIKWATDKLGLACELVADVGYSKTPWAKIGMLFVEKKAPKDQIIKMIARQLQKDRAAVSQK